MPNCTECGTELGAGKQICLGCGKPVDDPRTLQQLAGNAESSGGMIAAVRHLTQPAPRREPGIPWVPITIGAVILGVLGLGVVAIRVRNAKPPPHLGMLGGAIRMGAGMARHQPSRYFEGQAEYLENAAGVTANLRAQADLRDVATVTRSLANLMRSLEQLREHPSREQWAALHTRVERVRDTTAEVSQRTSNQELRAQLRELGRGCDQLLANWESLTRPAAP
jgi:hypothetical protein